MEIGTPALLFGSISLLLLSYTNRFVVIAKLIRDLHKKNSKEDLLVIQKQIPVLRKRLALIKYTQAFAVFAFIVCTISMFCVFLEFDFLGKVLFSISVIQLMFSLFFGLWEVILSTKALDILLDEVQIGQECK